MGMAIQKPLRKEPATQRRTQSTSSHSQRERS